MSQIRLHLRVFGARNIRDQIANAEAVFATAGISIDVRTENSFRISKLSDVDLSTSELHELRQAEAFPQNEFVVYFLQSLTPPMNGACFPGPLLIVTENYTPWTLAHEIGHAFDLCHIADDESVMGTTEKVQSPPPDFSDSEVATIGGSGLLFPVGTISTMRVTLEDVRSILLSQEPDYETAVRLGQEAIPYLEAIAADERPSVAANAVYLAGRIGGARASQIVAAAAQPEKPRPVRIAAAAAAAFLLPEYSNAIIRMLLKEVDYGILKTTLRSVPRGAADDVTTRLVMIIDTNVDKVLRSLAYDALERQR